MNLRENNAKLKKIVESNWIHVLYYMYIVFITNNVLEACRYDKISLVYGVVSMAILITIKLNSRKKMVRYTLGLLHFVLFLGLSQYYDFDVNQLRNTSFNSLLAYAYIFPDPITPFILLGIFWAKYYTFADEVNFRIMKGLYAGSTTTTVGYVAVFTFFRYLNDQKEKYKMMSITDALTGTFTLNHIVGLGNELLAKKKDISVVLLDLNNFKQLNDNFGHMAGNIILKDISAMLIEKTEDFKGIIGRIGGDEFVILLQDENHVDVEAFVDSLYETVHNKTFEVDPDLERMHLSFAFGIACSKDAASTDDMEKLLYQADIKMYYNKYQKKKSAINFKSTRFFLPDQVLQYLNVLAEKDMYTYVHSEHVAKFSADLAMQMGLPMEKVADIYISGWIHDIGKALIPNSILRKSGSLEESEYALIQEHIDIGINIIRRLEISKTIENGMKYHHERYDGTGYPFRTEGQLIPIEGRILKIVDAYSAMTIKRVYREALSKTEALAEIEKHKGTQFDPELVEQFKKMIIGEPKKNKVETVVNEWIEKMQYRLHLNNSYKLEN